MSTDIREVVTARRLCQAALNCIEAADTLATNEAAIVDNLEEGLQYLKDTTKVVEDGINRLKGIRVG